MLPELIRQARKDSRRILALPVRRMAYLYSAAVAVLLDASAVSAGGVDGAAVVVRHDGVAGADGEVQTRD